MEKILQDPVNSPSSLYRTHHRHAPCRLRIGTRGSPLALVQAELISSLLHAAHPNLPVPELVVIKTAGDRITDRPLSEIGGKGLFTKEIDNALMTGQVDLAVHSMKDVPTEIPQGLRLACLLPRADPRDVLISKPGNSLADLPSDCLIGTSSLRRQALLLQARPDLRVTGLRGNVQTRLAKLQSGAIDATLLAMAGLERLGLVDHLVLLRSGFFPLQSLIAVPLAIQTLLPAVAQGALGLIIRAEDTSLASQLGVLHCFETEASITAERACLAALEGSCQTPIAAFAQPEAGGQLWLRAMIAKPDGSHALTLEAKNTMKKAEILGTEVGTKLYAQAGPDYLTL